MGDVIKANRDFTPPLHWHFFFEPYFTFPSNMGEEKRSPEKKSARVDDLMG